MHTFVGYGGLCRLRSLLRDVWGIFLKIQNTLRENFIQIPKILDKFYSLTFEKIKYSKF
jgi:hypothetical protein